MSTDVMSKKFLLRNPEKEDFNQYWYSPNTIQVMAGQVRAYLEHSGAFLSTPSIYFSLPLDIRSKCKLFDFDPKFNKDPGFILYDFNKPEEIPVELHHSFDFIVIDPPFITLEVWQKYTCTVQLLLRDNGRILLSTIAENKDMMKDLLDVSPQVYQPSIPNLVYQYCLYTNYESKELQVVNPELSN